MKVFNGRLEGGLVSLVRETAKRLRDPDITHTGRKSVWMML